MKFIIDAQLPVRLKNWLVAQGFDSIHTDEIAIATQKETEDSEIAELAVRENRIVVSKDRDFSNLIFWSENHQNCFLLPQAILSTKSLSYFLKKILKPLCSFSILTMWLR